MQGTDSDARRSREQRAQQREDLAAARQSIVEEVRTLQHDELLVEMFARGLVTEGQTSEQLQDRYERYLLRLEFGPSAAKWNAAKDEKIRLTRTPPNQESTEPLTMTTTTVTTASTRAPIFSSTLCDQTTMGMENTGQHFTPFQSTMGTTIAAAPGRNVGTVPRNYRPPRRVVDERENDLLVQIGSAWEDHRVSASETVRNRENTHGARGIEREPDTNRVRDREFDENIREETQVREREYLGISERRGSAGQLAPVRAEGCVNCSCSHRDNREGQTPLTSRMPQQPTVAGLPPSVAEWMSQQFPEFSNREVLSAIRIGLMTIGAPLSAVAGEGMPNRVPPPGAAGEREYRAPRRSMRDSADSEAAASRIDRNRYREIAQEVHRRERTSSETSYEDRAVRKTSRRKKHRNDERASRRYRERSSENESTSPNRGRSPAHRGYRAMDLLRKWNLRFKSGSTEAAVDFMDTLLRKCKAADLGWADIKEAVMDAFSGETRAWYRIASRKMTSLKEFRKGFLEEYGPEEGNDAKWDRVIRRKQGDDECVRTYVVDQRTVFESMRPRPSLKEQINLVYRNMNPRIRRRMGYRDELDGYTDVEERGKHAEREIQLDRNFNGGNFGLRSRGSRDAARSTRIAAVSEDEREITAEKKKAKKKSPKKKTGTNKKKDSHTAAVRSPPPEKRRWSSGARTEPQNRPINPIARPSSDRMHYIVCYCCDQRGHYATDCPNRPNGAPINRANRPGMSASDTALIQREWPPRTDASTRSTPTEQNSARRSSYSSGNGQ